MINNRDTAISSFIVKYLNAADLENDIFGKREISQLFIIRFYYIRHHFVRNEKLYISLTVQISVRTALLSYSGKKSTHGNRTVDLLCKIENGVHIMYS